VIKGTRPSIDLIVAITNTAGASIEWLATGKGRPFKRGSVHPDNGTSAPSPINREIFHLVMEAVERAHKAERFSWSPASVAAEAIDAYDEVMDTVWAADDVGEVKALMPWIEYNLRAVLRAAKRADATKQIEESEPPSGT